VRSPDREEESALPRPRADWYRSAVDDEDALVLSRFDEETAVIAYWHHRLGEHAPEVDSDLIRRALLEEYGAGWRLGLFMHEVEDPAPPFPPAETA